MKETYDIPLISSVYEPLEKLKISGGYGHQRGAMRKKTKVQKTSPEQEGEQEEKNKEKTESENLVDITV